jgi:hypothetical protein
MDLFIKVIGLLVAVYALFPRERRLDLQLRFGVLDAFIFLCGVASVVYLDLYSFLKVHGLALAPPRWTIGLTTTQVSNSILLLMFFIFLLRARFARLSRRYAARFQQLTNELLWTQSNRELVVLVEANLTELFKIYRDDGYLQRLKRQRTPRMSFEYLHDLVDTGKGVPSERFLWKFLDPLIRRIPEHEREQAIASEALHRILSAKEFVSVLAQTRPYLGLTIFENLRVQGDKFLREEFANIYITALMADRSSVFYVELANNRNMESQHRYRLPPDNRLLNFLFRDARTAQDLEVYRFVGEFMLHYLDELSRSPAKDPYNQANTDDNSLMMHSALFAGVQLFDVMVSEALFQNIQWHMWLYYTTHFVKSIIRNYKPSDDPLIDPNIEFPIWYSKLLYDIFDALRGWIVALEDLPPDQANVQLQSTRPDHENDNIPKSSILATCICVHEVLLSDNLHSSLKESIMSVVFRAYFELRRTSQGARYAEVFRRALTAGGLQYSSPDPRYRVRLKAAFTRVDRIGHNDAHYVELESVL